MKIGRWFAREEFACRCGRPACDATGTPDPELVQMLDTLRDRVGYPLIVTSGLRCRWWNEHEGGEPNSGHLDGTEVDLAAPTSRARFHLVRAAFLGGFRRIGVYPKHVHLGIRTALPDEVLWLGDYRAG